MSIVQRATVLDFCITTEKEGRRNDISASIWSSVIRQWREAASDHELNVRSIIPTAWPCERNKSVSLPHAPSSEKIPASSTVASVPHRQFEKIYCTPTWCGCMRARCIVLHQLDHTSLALCREGRCELPCNRGTNIYLASSGLLLLIHDESCTNQRSRSCHPLASILYWHVVDGAFYLENDRYLHCTTRLYIFTTTRKVFIVGDDVMLTKRTSYAQKPTKGSSSFGCNIIILETD
jgi:hypothetical protein